MRAGTDRHRYWPITSRTLFHRGVTVGFFEVPGRKLPASHAAMQLPRALRRHDDEAISAGFRIVRNHALSNVLFHLLVQSMF